MYVKGPIKNPQITKIIIINENNSYNLSKISEELLKLEREQTISPLTFIADIFGQEIFSIHRRRDYASFQEYTRRNERKYGAKDNTINTKQQNGTRSDTKGNTSSKADSIETA